MEAREFMILSHRFTLFSMVILLLSGCFAPEAEVDQTLEEEPIAIIEAQQIPDWASTSHNGQNFNTSNLAYAPYIVYFSAPWCLHCEATLDAYDQAIPEGRMMIFSQDDDVQYANMSQWHENTESNLNRSIDRPFMLSPEFAKQMGVTSIPHVAFINEEGYVFQSEVGKRTNQSTLQNIWNATLVATYNSSAGWS